MSIESELQTMRFPLLVLPLLILSSIPSSAWAQTTFHGYDCTVDCSGHEAGYNWAEEHGITEPSECGGNSQSFIEGCQAYAGEEGSNEDEDEDEPNSDDQ